MPCAILICYLSFVTSCRMSWHIQNLTDSLVRLQPHFRGELVMVCQQAACKNTQLLAHVRWTYVGVWVSDGGTLLVASLVVWHKGKESSLCFLLHGPVDLNIYRLHCEIRSRVILCHVRHIFTLFIIIIIIIIITKFACNSIPHFSNYFSVASFKKGRAVA